MVATEKKILSCTLNRRQLLRYGLYGSLAGISGGLCLWGYKKLHATKKHNVLLIVLDTARADRFSFLGYHRKTSPNIDALAAESVAYQKAFAPSFWTLPSHASLFTGLFPSTAGATSETNQLPRFNKTLAEVLKKADYQTTAFSCNSWVSKERGFAKGFDEFYEMWRPKNLSLIPKQHGMLERATIKKVNTWLDLRKDSQNPFFLFVNLNCIHMPYKPPEPFCSLFLQNKNDKEKITRVSKIKGMWSYLAGKLELNQKELQIMSDLYDGEVAFADYCVGTIIEQLKTCDILDNTLVIITSDHGENIGEHKLIDHLMSMYETTLHIPLLIRYPGAFKAGTTYNGLVSLLNIAPTILDVCGIPEKLTNLMPEVSSLASSDYSPWKFVVAENERPINGLKIMKKKFPDFDLRKIDSPMRALRTERYKLIWSIGSKQELYDLNVDPNELNNLADKESKLRNKFLAMLVKWTAELPTPKETSFMAGKDSQSLELLRSLGYVE